MRKLALAISALVLLLVIALVSVAVILVGDEEMAPSKRALKEIPQDLVPLYKAAAGTCEGMDWTLLAAVHRTETSFGRGAAVSSAGARGPMQFMPGTWAEYGVDGDHDGRAAIDDLEDATFGAANYLCANGAGDPSRLRSAVFNYNHDLNYVDEVIDLALSYGVPSITAGAAVAQTSSKAILNNPRIILSNIARADVEQGLIDRRVLGALDLASRHFAISVSVLRTGHSPFVAGTTTLSNHYFGRGADIYAVNGRNVTAINADAMELAVWLGQLPSNLRPTEVGSPFEGILFTGAFSDADHRDHIHFGYD